METDAAEYFALNFGPDFPIVDVLQIAQRLTASRALVPGFIPSPRGPLDLVSISYEQHIDKWRFVVLPDKNLVSRMARLARHGSPEFMDLPTQLAADVMAFAQAMDFDIEPSLAVHEEAHKLSNNAAHDELQWFRAADACGKADEWVELAQGRRRHISTVSPGERVDTDLAFPLSRWRRNYIVALKIAELEYASMLSGREKVLTLYKWMYEDFIVAGPAAIFAAYYFAPNARRAGMMKRLYSVDREKAIAGVRNAAWDITHLSDFVRRVSEADQTHIRYLLASGDLELARIAPVLLQTGDEACPTALIQAFSDWWPSNVAETLATELANIVGRATEETYRRQRQSISIDQWIGAGEDLIRKKSDLP